MSEANDGSPLGVIASSAPAGGRPALNEKEEWHRRPCRCPPLGGGVFSPPAGTPVPLTLFCLAKRSNPDPPMFWIASPAARNDALYHDERRTAGFTLMEVLVALVVLGLLTTGLAQGLHYGFKVWDSQAADIARRDRLDAVDRTLRQLIGQIDTRNEETPVPFVGEADHFDFTTLLPNALSLVSRRADASLLVDGRHRLILRWTPHLHATPLGQPRRPIETELLTGVERIEFHYWTPSGWQPAWNDREPPELVRIHLVFAPGDSRRWPDIVAARLLERAPK